MSDVTKNIIASLISAVLIALVFSVWNDYFYKEDNLTGFWKVEFETTESSYKNYIGLKTYYEFVIGQNGNSISGTGEKVSEDSVNGVIEYDTKKRTHLELSGGVTYKIFTNNLVDIVYCENGTRRKSSTILNLSIDSKDKMTGTYISTIAESRGKATFIKSK